MPKTIKLILICSVLLHLNTALAVGDQKISFSSQQRQTTMIELFTSQGCSSCPPAEQWLNSLKDDKNLWAKLVPIAFHVDYWDKLGWPDPYASEAYSARQYRHRQQNHIRSVYTPGLVVNGKEWRGWSRGNSFPAGNSNAGVLAIHATQDELNVTYNQARADIVLNVAILGFGIETHVKRGENHDRTLAQEFVALSHQQYVASNGAWTIPFPTKRTKPAKEYALAVWVSRHPDISPIQSTGSWIPKEWVEGL